MVGMAEDLTQLQIRSLPETYNFTDGHAHRPFDEQERAAISSLDDIFFEVERERQFELEYAYIEAFYGLHHQTVRSDKTKYLLLPSASLSLEVVANYLRLAKLDLALTEPCFDNLANMFKRHNISLEPFPDKNLEADDFPQRLAQIRSKAICIVSPNNPTGITCSPKAFRQLVAFCKQEHRLLIMDSSFRAYKQPEDIFDEYDLLQQSGIEYIMVEDTGKTWPTKELKVSVLAMSHSIYDVIFDIYTDFLYHHSPFNIKFLTELIRFSTADNLQSIKSVIKKNRQMLHKTIEGSFLIPHEKQATSVAWLRIDHDVTGVQLAAILKASGIFILPGQKFFWSDNSNGDQYVRIALAREPEAFERAMQRFGEILSSLSTAERSINFGYVLPQASNNG